MMEMIVNIIDYPLIYSFDPREVPVTTMRIVLIERMQEVRQFVSSNEWDRTGQV